MKGFTLLETVLASAVALVIGVLLVGILVNHSGLFYQQRSLISEGVDANDTLSVLDRYIREAAAVAAGYPPSSPNYSSGQTTLVLKLPSLGPSGVLAETYDFLVIAQDVSQPKILRMQIFPGSQSMRQPENLVLTTLLESIQFTYLDKTGATVNPIQASSIRTKLSVLSQTGSIGSTRSSEMLTTLRNFNQ